MLHPVSDQASHSRALKRIEQLWDATAGSAAELELDALATLVDAYERKIFPVPPLDPVEAIRLRCDELGLSRRDLEPFIGSRARVSEVLSGKRSLTLAMIRKLHQALRLPAEVLIAQPAKRPLARTRGNQSSSAKASQFTGATAKRRKSRA
jgi:HTH-type transcriptional regulator / antitoxin HigA